MKLAILGGSFNPIHLGHLFLADTVISELHYDRVILIPAYRSPFKLAAEDMEENSRDRLEMTAASIAGDPRLAVDDCEIRRRGISYTVDTITDIIQRYNPEGKPGVILGDDIAAEFPLWHESDKILAMADIIIARRIHSGNLKIDYPNTQITNNVIEISSGTIREMIAKGSAWHYLVPAPARNIIEKHRLFGLEEQPAAMLQSSNGGNGGNGKAFNVKSISLRVEDTAREALNLERFLHSRSTALFAWDLCRRFRPLYPSLDPELGYLAGIAHDLAKQLEGKELLKLAKNDKKRISQLEKKKPVLLHGRASAVLLKKQFKVNNKDVLEAIAMHTFAGENMCPLAKIIYIADKMEFCREKANPSVRKMAYTEDNLDNIFYTVFAQTVAGLRSKKLNLTGETKKLLAKMKEFSGEKRKGR
ncbi:MAG: nicotinate (nicotinamide) nucleotide adenylyltransferase [Treponema sp.]|nr:nicotinate (nicotinamide) nucleotide adenylyltransferase [Treponema sp.]